VEEVEMDVQAMIAHVGNLVSLPEVWVRVNELLEDPNCATGRLGEVIGLDPGLTARMLKIVNSAYYGLSARVETVPHAISMIGTEDLRHLVLATSAVQAFQRIPTDLVDMETFWHHSVCCALGARLLAARRRGAAKERFFVAGLLHDVGQLVLYHAAPELSRKVLAKAAAGEGSAYLVERELMGWTHADVGASLLKAWNIPEGIVEAVRFHHEPARATQYCAEASVVHIANGIASALEPARKGPRSAWDSPLAIEGSAWEAAGLDPSVAEAMRQEVAAGAFEILEVISPGATLIF
jgi:HD-like signal output (HDOD) protein